MSTKLRKRDVQALASEVKQSVADTVEGLTNLSIACDTAKDAVRELGRAILRPVMRGVVARCARDVILSILTPDRAARRKRRARYRRGLEFVRPRKRGAR